ncbi:YuzD family protein [Domibacillus antri]|nr:YuzD family protein [Domibacillus antri]
MEITVYGADQICAGCVNLPSSKDTYEWLEAAISRKFPDQPFTIEYVDIFSPPDDELKKEMAARVIEDDLFYPVVFIGNEMVAEGNPRLKPIFAKMEKHGYTPGV